MKNDTVRILEDGTDDEVFSFKVRGKGIAGKIVVRQGANAEGDIIDNGLTNPPLDSPAHFQTWPAGISNVIQTFAIKNTGNTPHLVSSVSILGNQAFTISTVNPGSFIDVGNYVTFTVDFVPTSAGTKSATVSIASADPQIPIFTFEVVGIATGAPDLAVTGSPNSNGPFLAIPDQASLTSTGNGTDFGTLNAAIGSETSTFEITNTGNAQLTISSISESSPHFNVGSFPTVIGVGNTKSFTVTFDPTSSGPKSTEIEIISNAVGSAGSYTFVVTGRGEAAKILVKGGLDQDKLIQHGQTIPSVDNGTDFGLVNTNGTASVKTFAISNSGDFNLTIISATSSNHDFALANIPTVAQPIAPGSEQDFEISFDPSSVGLLDSTITIKSNDPGTPEFTFIVEGFGSDNQPEIQVVGLNNQVIQSGAAIPTKLNGTLFGPVDINGTARQKTFTIENLGTGSLNLGTITDNSPRFQIASQPTGLIGPGESGELVIGFLPNAEANFEAIISIPSNDSDEAIYTFKVSGIGTNTPPPAEPELALSGGRTFAVAITNGDNSPRRFDGTQFPATEIGDESSRSFRITNNGQADLNISSIDVVNLPGAIDFTATTVAPGASIDFTVTLSPDAPTIGTHTIEIFSNDPNQSPFSFDLALLGVDPARPIVVTDFQVLGENLEITFQADPNKTYRIAYSNDLKTWARPASLSGIPGDLSPQSYLITGVASQSPRTFLRIEEN